MLRISRATTIAVLAATVCLATEDRVTGPVDSGSTAPLKAQPRHNLRAEDDRGAVDPATPIRYATLYLQPAPGLEAFLSDQQTPSSPNYHRWLTPEQFGDRFGLTPSDLGKITDWLKGAGFTVHDVARGRHWITFSGTAGQAEQAFHTEIHRFIVNDEPHYANTTDISVPAALAGVISGVAGLDDFRLQPYYRQGPAVNAPAHTTPGYTTPEYTTGSTHILAPDDVATIYDIAPLYGNGIDGTGQKIAIIGETDINLADIREFRAEFQLPPNDPKVMLYGPDPGVRAGDLTEADLDLEISGSVARNATIIFVNSQSVVLSAQYAVDQNLAPVMSESYGGCETDSPLPLSSRSVAQQANAQGITWMVASGDSAAATCDRFAPTPQAETGTTVSFPASLPEVTAVGGTEFNEGSGSYWSRFNTVSFASALSYIPERVWNDTAALNQLDGGGGGASAVFSKPTWQTGPGVPADGARDLPDVSFNSSFLHDGYYVVSGGNYYVLGGTSVATPLFAGIVTLLNESVAKTSPGGLGNINPALYRLAQATSDVVHDITVGDNVVPCAQGTPDCVNGALGYKAGPGYDAASGLGSVDAARLIAEWNTGNASTTSLSANPAPYPLTANVQLTATVSGTGGIPTGTVTFVGADVTLGTAALVSGTQSASATISVAGTILGGGDGTVGALYSGDGTFLASTGSATIALQIPAGGHSYVIPSVTPNPVPLTNPVWDYTLTLREMGGTGTTITAFMIDGVNNIFNLSSKSIGANGSMSVFLFADLTVPANRDFHFAGADADGYTWTRDITVPFVATTVPSSAPAMSVTPASPMLQQNPAASSTCAWSQPITIQELSGYEVTLTSFVEGSDPLTPYIPQLFGTTRLAPWGMLTGTMCFANPSPAVETYVVGGIAEIGTSVAASASVTLESAPTSVSTFSAIPASVVIPVASSSGTAVAAVTLNFSLSSLPTWTASIMPSTQKWLTVSAVSGTGNSTLTLRASAAGLSNGVYNAVLSIAATNASPQAVQIPVALVVGASSNISITGIGNAASGAQVFAPGELMAVYGNNLAPTNAIAGIQPLPLILAGASATVDGVAAPLWFISPGQINLQIPYETSAGPAVLGITNNGEVASYTFNVTPTGPGIFQYQGSMVPEPSGTAGQTVFGFITGDGDVTPSLASGATSSPEATIAQLPHSRQALTMTIGGENAVPSFDGIVSGLIGVTQVNFVIPSNLAPGTYPVVVTVGGVSSAPVNLTVTAPM